MNNFVTSKPAEDLRALSKDVSSELSLMSAGSIPSASFDYLARGQNNRLRGCKYRPVEA